MGGSLSDRQHAMRAQYFPDASQIFADVVRRYHDRPALLWSAAQATSYEELDKGSNHIARVLLARGVRKGDSVCICLEKALVTYASIIACLKLGLPYFIV